MGQKWGQRRDEGEKPYLLKKKGIAGLARTFLQPPFSTQETSALSV